MPQLVDINVVGAKGLERALLSLTTKQGKAVVRKSVRNGSKVILKAAKVNANNMVGGNLGTTIAKFLILRAWRRQKRNAIGMNIRISKEGNSEFVHIAKRSSKYKGGRTYIPTAIEYGHVFPNGTFVPPEPFMRSAFDVNESVVNAKIMNEMWYGIGQIFLK